MLLGTESSQEFFNFISLQKEKSNFENLEMILRLENNHPRMFTKVMTNFEKAKKFRETLDEQGKPIRVPWEEALKNFYILQKYSGVTKENQDIAVLFNEKGIEQSTFKEADNLRQKAKEKGVPKHILGKDLREDTILESIEKIRNETAEILLDSKKLIEELFEKQFTYEWLNKKDPHNAIIGLFCSCCGSITSATYGGDIARATVVAKDVQNLVVRNSKGEIISKGSMYINKDLGYAVINDFELNKKYREHEATSGIYVVSEDSKEEQERKLIFKAFQRGLKSFIEEYDKQNPNNPIKQVNVGMGYNRLKRQVERFEKATENLTIPPEYGFYDAMKNEQYVLYRRSQEKKYGLEEQENKEKAKKTNVEGVEFE